ncbi:MAG: hypothetical protein ACYSWU_02530, partial [Planctomycetota bacterium]
MSDQSFESAPDRASREWLFVLLFGAFVFFLTTAGFWSYGYLTEKLIYQQNQIKGRLLVDQAMFAVHFESWETNESAAFLAKKLAADLTGREAYEYSFITSESLAAAQRDENRREEETEFDLQVARQFSDAAFEPSQDSDTSPFAERLLPNRNEYQYCQPIYADAPECIICHTALGDTAFGAPTSGPPTGDTELTGGPLLSE